MKGIISILLILWGLGVAGQNLMPLPHVNEHIYQLQKFNNNLYIAGDFTQIDSTTINYLAKIKSTNGVLDPTWLPLPNGTVNALIQCNGKIVVGGSFTSISSQSRNYLAIYDAATGTLDPIAPNLTDYVTALYSVGNWVYYNARLSVPGYADKVVVRRFDINTGAISNWQCIYSWYVGDKVNTMAQLGNYLYLGLDVLSGQNLQRADTTTGIIDSSWHPVFSGNTMNKLIADSSFVYLAGVFDSVNHLFRPSYAAFDINGNLTNHYVYAFTAHTFDIFKQGNTMWLASSTPSYGCSGRIKVAQMRMPNGCETCWDAGSVLLNGLTEADALAVSNDTVFVGGYDNFYGGSSLLAFTGTTHVNAPIVTGPTTVLAGQPANYSIYNPPTGYSGMWLKTESGVLYSGAHFSNNFTQTWTETGVETLYVWLQNYGGCTSDTTRMIVHVLSNDTLQITSVYNFQGQPVGRICPNDSFVLEFENIGYTTQNMSITAQLSDSTGSFANPINIGNAFGNFYTGWQPSNNHLVVQVPPNVRSGNDYHFRIICNNHPFTSIDTGSFVCIKGYALLQGDTVCQGNYTSLNLNSNAADSYMIEWFVNGAPNTATAYGLPCHLRLNNGDLVVGKVDEYCINGSVDVFSDTLHVVTVSNAIIISPDPSSPFCGVAPFLTASETDTTSTISSYQWYDNGQYLGFHSVYSSGFHNNDSILVEIIYANAHYCPAGVFISRKFRVTLLSASSTTITQTICSGQSFLGYSVTGTYNDTFTAANGCDSIRTLNLTVNNAITNSVFITICQGQSYAGYGANGTYIDTFIRANGCDSIRTLDLTVLPVVSTTVSQTICQGQGYLGYFTSGTFTNIYIGSNGCDSIRTLNLTVLPIARDTVAQSICQGQSYLGYATSGSFVDTFAASNGCDSIRTLNLLVLPNVNDSIAVTLAAGQSYYGYNTSGSYIDTFAAANGCDSIRLLTLTVLPPMDTVWPGDANFDGVADNNDLLNIGIAYGDIGPTRPSATNNWTAQPCPLWTNSFISGINHNNADCNGDGVVDGMDTAVVLLNYGFTHPKNTNEQRLPGTPQLYVQALPQNLHPGDTCTLVFNLGDASLPVSNLYGLAFKTTFDHSLIKPGSMMVDYSQSWMGNRNIDLLTLTKDLANVNQLDIGISRNDHNNRNGYGEVVRVTFIVNNTLGNDSVQAYPIALWNMTAIDSIGNNIPIGSMDDTLLIHTKYNGIASLQLDNIQLSLVPNPSSGDVLITSNAIIDEYAIIDVNGRKIANGKPINSKDIVYSTTTLTNGIYLVQVTVSGQTITRRLVVLHL